MTSPSPFFRFWRCCHLGASTLSAGLAAWLQAALHIRLHSKRKAVLFARELAVGGHHARNVLKAASQFPLELPSHL